MNDTDDLELLFAAARADAPRPSPALMARVLADAYDAQPAAPAPVAVTAPTPWWSRAMAALSASFGGGGVLAGLGTAAVAGVFLGYASPNAADWLSEALTPAADSLLMPSAADLFLSEG
ncbi:MAG: dihydroorotate dehydrogenase [Paracoccaceae bacterium]